MEKFKVPVAVVVLIARNVGGINQILLQRRQNTGFGDGMWDFACSGHVEEGESLTAACSRECREELGISADAQDFEFFTLFYKRDGQVTYVNPYFVLQKFMSEPHICEPHKCAELEWFCTDNLPEDLLPDRKAAYNALMQGLPYVEYTT